MVSTEKLLALREWYGNPNLACLPIAGAAAAAVVAALDELLAFREGYDPAERLPENTCDVVVDVVIMDSPSGEIIEHQLSYWFEGKWRTFDSDGAEAVLSDGYRVTRWYPLPGGER